MTPEECVGRLLEKASEHCRSRHAYELFLEFADILHDDGLAEALRQIDLVRDDAGNSGSEQVAAEDIYDLLLQVEAQS